MSSTTFTFIEETTQKLIDEANTEESDEDIAVNNTSSVAVSKTERKPRGKKWCETDDELLCEAWIYTSEDGDKGALRRISAGVSSR
ncbi:hypothetical protein G6F56_006729 [Rhizopus delemar]|nr:hypothetical protein G6F56_006729 [Rhizopus delemar]